MSDPDKSRILSLVELEELARQPSSENWHYLLRGLTDHFLMRPDVHVDQYGDAFSDIVCRILDRVALDARVELSTRVAPLEKFPNRIVTRLAQDEVPVATPVLEQSPVLSDSDLIAIANAVMEEHQLAISRRQALGPRLTEALVKVDSPEVIRAVAGNPGARFSASTYRMVAERAKKDEILQATLIERPDMTSAIAILINPFLSPELKSRLAEKAPKAEKGLLDSLSELTMEEKKKDGFDPDPDPEGIQDMIERVGAGKLELSRAVAELADQGRIEGVCTLVCAVGGLLDKTVRSAIVNTNGMPISVICRGLGLSRDAFEAVSHMRGEQLTLGHAEVVGLVERYLSLDVDDARKTLGVLQAKKAAEAA